jgi:GNAT superfamily N-acetyltransferase
MSAVPSGFSVVAVASRATRRAFLELPRKIFANDPAWPQPFVREEALRFLHSHPFYEHGEAQFWIVLRGETTVGRISAQINHLHAQVGREGVGQFGHFLCVDDDAVAKALLDTASAWLKARGATLIEGPFSLSVNEESGLLIDGFDVPPALLSAHHPPYARSLLERAGFTLVERMFGYRMNIAALEDAQAARWDLALKRMGPMLQNRLRVRTVPPWLPMKDFEITRNIFNEAWADNAGFVPMTSKEMKFMRAELWTLICRGSFFLAEIDGKPAAVVMCVLDANTVSRDCGGRLFPFGWARVAWRLITGRIPRGRILLVGIKREHQNSLLGAAAIGAIFFRIRQTAKNLGLREMECAWIVESNVPMRRVLESLELPITKTWGIFRRDL